MGFIEITIPFFSSEIDGSKFLFTGISRRMRPKSLSIGTPTKLLSLEEAQSKKLGLDSGQDNYIEVGK